MQIWGCVALAHSFLRIGIQPWHGMIVHLILPKPKATMGKSVAHCRWVIEAMEDMQWAPLANSVPFSLWRSFSSSMPQWYGQQRRQCTEGNKELGANWIDRWRLATWYICRLDNVKESSLPLHGWWINTAVVKINWMTSAQKIRLLQSRLSRGDFLTIHL